MKKWMKVFAAAAAAICLCAPATVEAKACATDEFMYNTNYLGDMTVVNCDEWVSLRSAADTSSACLAKVPRGATVTDCVISGRDSRFISCCYDGYQGFILSEYLASGPVYEPEYLGDMTVVNCDEWVSLRSAADTSSARLAKVPLGATVTGCVAGSADGRFISCCYNGYQGFILSEYLAFGPEEVFEPVYIGDMSVVNCDEWVSLRNAPSQSSPRILKVPLGAAVTDCLLVSDEFVYCRYGGASGYILAEYLCEGAISVPETDCDGMMNFGRSVLEYRHDGYTVVSGVNYLDSGEILKTVCYDSFGDSVWHYDTVTNNGTELEMTHAFIAGTDEKPLVMIFNVDVGLTALDFYTGEELWILPDYEVSLGAGITAAADENGNMYIGGYYGPDPVAIDKNGRVLWQANPGIEAYWLYEIEVTDEGVRATYDCLYEHEHSGWILYDRATGSVLSKSWF